MINARSFVVGALAALSISALACGGGGSSGPDGGTGPDGGSGTDPKSCKDLGGAHCFALPKASTTVTVAGAEKAANWACAKPAATTSTMPIVVSGAVKDFQNGDPQPMAEVDAFYGLDFSTGAIKAMATADASGNYMVTLPAGAPSRMNWRSKGTDLLDTYALNDKLDTTAATATQNRSPITAATAAALPAFIGVTRTPGLGVLAGNIVDCDGNNVKHAIATVSSTSSHGNVAPAFVAGAQVYYFSNASTDLPVRRTMQTDSNGDGLFVIIEIPPTSGAAHYFLQVWGFEATGDVAMGMSGLKLISEFEAPVLGDSVISMAMDPSEGM